MPDWIGWFAFPIIVAAACAVSWGLDWLMAKVKPRRKL